LRARDAGAEANSDVRVSRHPEICVRFLAGRWSTGTGRQEGQPKNVAKRPAWREPLAGRHGLQVYRKRYPDLKNMKYDELMTRCLGQGRDEGRSGKP
jgi:hypothetical protein